MEWGNNKKQDLVNLQKNYVRRIIAAYNSVIIRLYIRIRFLILRQRFLIEIGQYLPQQGHVLDIGCGFGLFSLFYALTYPKVLFTGIDLNASRIRHAENAAKILGTSNATYQLGDAASLALQESYDAIYMLDIVHHITPDTVAPLMRHLHSALVADGTLLIKDVDYYPTYQRWFTWWLDKLMDWRTPVHYWQSNNLIALLEECRFKVFMHRMPDILPYPHILYICRKA